MNDHTTAPRENEAAEMARYIESDLQAKADRLVHNEVLCCLSTLVSEIACRRGDCLHALHEQAAELCAPIEDWESAARDEGYRLRVDNGKVSAVLRRTPDSEPEGFDLEAQDFAGAWREICEELANVDPYDREVFEHWAVTDHFAAKLEAKGEKVDRDFAGLTVWARTTTGQAIAMDEVVREIVREIHNIPHP